MGNIDAESKKYMSDNAHFADTFNYLIYDGRPVIDPEKLSEVDTTEIVIPYGNEAREPEQKYRDVLKQWKAMTDGEAIYVVLGGELQDKVHYAMPVKDMLYDSMHYAKQVEEARKSYRKSSDRGQGKKSGEQGQAIEDHSGEQSEKQKNQDQPEHFAKEKTAIKLTSAEFLSGFRKEDKLMPVITLVVYFGASEWDGPKNIHEMLSTKNEHLLKFVQDYRIHLIAPAQMEDEDFLKFQTDFGKVLQYIKYSKDKETLYKIVHEEKHFQDIDQESADLINVVTGSELKYEAKGGRVNMCTAIDEMRKESRQEGFLEALASLVKKGLLSLSDAAKEAGLSTAEFQAKTDGMK